MARACLVCMDVTSALLRVSKLKVKEPVVTLSVCIVHLARVCRGHGQRCPCARRWDPTVSPTAWLEHGWEVTWGKPGLSGQSPSHKDCMQRNQDFILGQWDTPDGFMPWQGQGQGCVQTRKGQAWRREVGAAPTAGVLER